MAVKTINMAMADFKEAITKDLRDSGLPIMAAASILEEISISLGEQAKKIVEQEKKEYQEQLQQEAKEKSSKVEKAAKK